MTVTVVPQPLGDILDPYFIRTGLVGSGGVKQGYIVKHDTTVQEIVLASAATDASVGMALADADAGKYASYAKLGQYTRAVAGAALSSLNTELAADSSGRFAAATTGDTVIGKNKTTASGADVTFTVELVLPYKKPA